MMIAVSSAFQSIIRFGICDGILYTQEFIQYFESSYEISFSSNKKISYRNPVYFINECRILDLNRKFLCSQGFFFLFWQYSYDFRGILVGNEYVPQSQNSDQYVFNRISNHEFKLVRLVLICCTFTRLF